MPRRKKIQIAVSDLKIKDSLIALKDNRKGELDLIVRKSELAKAIGISRPTIDRWCKDGLISSGVKSDLFLGDNNFFDLGVVLRQLQKAKE